MAALMNCLTTIKRMIQEIVPVLLTAALVSGLAGCATGNHAVRTWVDEQTAVAVTAQKRAMVFYRDDSKAGTHINDFADLGALEVDQSGVRHQYLCLLLWSTLARTPQQQQQVEDAFANLVIWADDQPLTFKRLTQNHDMLNLSSPAFKQSAFDVRESYYEITPAQLNTLAAAKELRVAPANQSSSESPYHPWRDEHDSLAAFAAEVSSTAKLIDSRTH